MADRLDWDRERRDGRVRSHGSERATVRQADVKDMDAVLKARFAGARDDAFYDLVEPLRLVASEYGASERTEEAREAHLGRLREAADAAIGRMPDSIERSRVDAYRASLEQRFFRLKKRENRGGEPSQPSRDTHTEPL